MGLSQVIHGDFHTIRHRYSQTLLASTPSSICFWRTYLSPKPWAMITVAVCFLSAGTMYGPRVILPFDICY
jgi:hypothetical protein